MGHASHTHEVFFSASTRVLSGCSDQQRLEQGAGNPQCSTTPHSTETHTQGGNMNHRLSLKQCQHDLYSKNAQALQRLA
jgi:hypothetical protein